MNADASKGWKPFIVKVAIIIMSLLYVLGPVHREVKHLLHSITHVLEMPDQVLSHKDETTAILGINAHKSKYHIKKDSSHHHKLITFIEEILKSSGQSKSESSPIKVKVDKHIQNYNSEAIDNTTTLSHNTRNIFYEKEKRICKGYLNGTLDPPKA